MTRTTWIARSSLIALITLIVVACGGSAHVASVRATTPESHTYRTFAVVEHPVNVDEIDPSLREAIVQRMEALGYTEAEPAVADLHVQYGLLLSRQESALPSAVPPGGDAAAILIAADVDSAETTRKVLLVMMDERGSNHIVWMGVSTADVTDAELEEATLEAVGQVMGAVPSAGHWAD